MDQRPEQPPEGKLIGDAANRMNLSIREAARRAGLSYGRWRQIVQGYQNTGPGVYGAVHAPPATLARMAAVVHVTAEQMETRGRRPDAAEIMRETEAAAPPDRTVLPPATPEMLAAMRPYMNKIEGRLEVVRGLAPGQPVTGPMIFPKQPRYAEIWDIFAGLGYDETGRTYVVAAAMEWDGEETGDRKRAAARLTRAG
jgi:hypothetical protein